MRISKEPEVRRAELVKAARELFDRNGIKNTQVSQIVDKVGVAKGLFYYYFKSKDEIVNEVVKEVMSELREDSEESWPMNLLLFIRRHRSSLCCICI